jgi:cell wall-associated NlpC family hydrolase
MRKIKNFSLTLVIIPIMQTGCMQDRASQITPPKMDKNVTVDTKDNNQSDRNISSTSTEIYNPPYYVATQLEMAELEPIIEESEDIVYEEQIGEPMIVSDTYSSDIGSEWSELSKEEAIIETAKSFLGTKYVWAANGPDCFDCSGFTKYVFNENGITLPRYSGHQAKVGIKVSYDELQKGDLVFFDTEHKFRGKVNHVGIYIGNNKFIHASSAGKKVMITSFKEKPFYRRRFLRGERVIDSDSAYASL